MLFFRFFKINVSKNNFKNTIRVYCVRPGPEFIKLFFILNSTEFEIYHTHKS